MTREEGMRVLAGYLAISSSISAVGNFANYLSSDADKAAVSDVLAAVVALVYEKGMKPILALHPDLDPDNLNP